MAHGEFRSVHGDCPHGCSNGLVRKVANVVSGYTRTDKTGFIDRKRQDLARQFGESEFNDRYDTHRIKPGDTNDIQKKRLAGQTYSVPLDPKTGVAGFLGSTEGADFNVPQAAKAIASEGLKTQTHIAHDDKGTTKMPEAA